MAAQRRLGLRWGYCAWVGRLLVATGDVVTAGQSGDWPRNSRQVIPTLGIKKRAGGGPALLGSLQGRFGLWLYFDVDFDRTVGAVAGRDRVYADHAFFAVLGLESDYVAYFQE